MTLAALKPGQKARILEINELEENSHRLSELGLVEGQEVTILKQAPLGDPISLRIMNYELCLRKADAAQIRVEIPNAT